LELQVGAGGHRHVEEPVWIVGGEHGADGGVKGGAPIAEFDGVTGEEDVVPDAGGGGVVDREGDGDEFGLQNSELNGVGERAAAGLELRSVKAIGNGGDGEGDGAVRPGTDGGSSGAEEDAAGGRAEAFPGDGGFNAGLAASGADRTNFGSGSG